jgi:hypothetical protein
LRAGDTRRTLALLEHALAAAPPGVAHAAVLVHFARARGAVAGPGEAVAVYREALAESVGDAPLEATIHLELASALRFTEGVDSGLAHGEMAVHAASRVDDPVLRCRALAAFGLLHFNAGRGIPLQEMELALALERSLPEWPLAHGPAAVSGHQLLWSGELTRPDASTRRRAERSAPAATRTRQGRSGT